MDRDSHSGAHWYFAFNDGAEAYQSANKQGKQLQIKSPATGTNSVNTPLLAVGNTKYNGKNPPKYLNAEFNWFKIKIGDNEWIEVSNGSMINVPSGSEIIATASVGNLQEATWLTPESAKGKPGAVYLASTDKSRLEFKKAIAKNTPWQKDTDFGESFILTNGISKEMKVEFQMTAEGRAWFGEKKSFTLIPMNE